MSALLRVAGVALVLFHVWLFASMVADGRLADPAVAFRWLVAAGLALGLLALRRAGLPLVFSRQGAALWVLVVLLHASAFASPAGPVATSATDDVAALFVLPATSAVVTVVAAWILIQARAGRAATAAARRPLWRLLDLDPAFVSPRLTSTLAPRAPPSLHATSF